MRAESHRRGRTPRAGPRVCPPRVEAEAEAGTEVGEGGQRCGLAYRRYRSEEAARRRQPRRQVRPRLRRHPGRGRRCGLPRSRGRLVEWRSWGPPRQRRRNQRPRRQRWSYRSGCRSVLLRGVRGHTGDSSSRPPSRSYADRPPSSLARAGDRKCRPVGWNLAKWRGASGTSEFLGVPGNRSAASDPRREADDHDGRPRVTRREEG